MSSRKLIWTKKFSKDVKRARRRKRNLESLQNVIEMLQSSDTEIKTIIRLLFVFGMPRKARIDAAGALDHIIVRGIERRKIFWDDADRDSFVNRLGKVLIETDTDCFAWAMIPNHVHLLMRTGLTPISTVMKRL